MDVVATLEAEAASLSQQLVAADRDTGELLPLEAELAAAEEAQAREVAEAEEHFGDADAQGEGGPDGGALGGQAGEVRAELAALARSSAHIDAELARLGAREEAVEARRRRLTDEIGRAEVVINEADGLAGELGVKAREAAEQLAVTERVLAEAQEARRQADGERQRWSARAEALSEALDEARARAGARRLASVDGALGALVELVQVDEGHEAAFEAAAGEALSAVLVQDQAAARRGLAHLAGQNASGAVMPLELAGALMSDPSRPEHQRISLPEGAAWLRQHVHSRFTSVLELLDRLLAGAVVVDGGWQGAVDLAERQPELVVVSRDGDRCAGGIWRTGLHSSGVTGAALEEARTAFQAAADAARNGESRRIAGSGPPRRGPGR